MAALPPGEHVIVGTLSGLEPKTNGWMRFSITREGNQYPDKVDTSKPEIIAQATALMGQLVSAQVNVQQSDTPNPHKPGTFYMNRYLNAIGPAAEGAMTQQPQQQAQGQQRARGGHTGEQFDPVRMARMGGSERAVQMAAAGLIPESQQTVTGLVEVAETWAAYFLLGPERFGVKAFNAPPEPQPQAQSQQQSFEDPGSDAPPVEDDIPFAWKDDYGREPRWAVRWR